MVWRHLPGFQAVEGFSMMKLLRDFLLCWPRCSPLITAWKVKWVAEWFVPCWYLGCEHWSHSVEHPRAKPNIPSSPSRGCPLLHWFLLRNIYAISWLDCAPSLPLTSHTPSSFFDSPVLNTSFPFILKKKHSLTPNSFPKAITCFVCCLIGNQYCCNMMKFTLICLILTGS